MKIKLLLLIISLFVMGNVLMACGASNGDRDLIASSDLLKTEKTFPDNFYELAEHGVLVKKVINQDEFDEHWDHFELKENPLKIDWNNKAVFFLGIIESGSCPIEFKSVELSPMKTDLIFHLETDSKKRACTDDATPRTIVIAVDAVEVSDIAFVEIYNYNGSNPRVSLEEDYR